MFGKKKKYKYYKVNPEGKIIRESNDLGSLVRTTPSDRYGGPDVVYERKRGGDVKVDEVGWDDLIMYGGGNQ